MGKTLVNCSGFAKSTIVFPRHRFALYGTLDLTMGLSYKATKLLFHLCVDGRFSEIGSHMSSDFPLILCRCKQNIRTYKCACVV